MSQEFSGDSSASNTVTISVKKNFSEAMGMTLRKDKDGRCIIGRIMIGGLIHRHGALHVGDEIIEINGESVLSDDLEFIQRLLKTAHGLVYITVTPNYWRDPQNCEIYVRAMFDYEPVEDKLLPASQMGLSFMVGDILRIISKDDNNWWQAQQLDSDVDSPARLIPSGELQEGRAVHRLLQSTGCYGSGNAANTSEDSPLHQRSLISSSCNPFLLRQRCRRLRRKNRQKTLPVKCNGAVHPFCRFGSCEPGLGCGTGAGGAGTSTTVAVTAAAATIATAAPASAVSGKRGMRDISNSSSSSSHSAAAATTSCNHHHHHHQHHTNTTCLEPDRRMHLLMSDLEFAPYEEVIEVAEHYRKTLILLGAHGVGRRHIKNCLVQSYPHVFGAPVPHTSKPPQPNQINGKDYFFVSQEEMLSDIANNLFLEYGRQGDILYGIKLETVRRIVACKLIPVLDVEPQTLRLLRNGEFSPFVVFISPPDLNIMSDSAREISDGSLERLSEESELLEALYRPFIDMEVVNYSIEDTIEPIVEAINELHSNPQWIPVTWIY